MSRKGDEPDGNKNRIANEEQNTDDLPVSASSAAAARDLLVIGAISRRSARG
jgi:hypothetical protein